MAPLDEKAEQEVRMILMLQNAIKNKQTRQGWSLETMGEKLGIPAAGVKVLMCQAWSLEKAVRVAAVLGIEFGLTILPTYEHTP